MGSDLKVRALLAVVTVTSSCALLHAYFDPQPVIPLLPPPPAVALPEPSGDAGTAFPPMWIEGPMLRGIDVAVTDLAARNGERSPEPTEDAFLVCLSRVDTYDVQVVREDADRWVIYVGPRAWRCFDGGGSMKGGDATYEISKADFGILSAQFGE